MLSNKCPYCGGNLEVIDNELNAVCDSCGEKVSIAELNNLKMKKQKISTYESENDKLDHDYNSAFVSQEEIKKLTPKKLFEQVNLALNTQDWIQAERLCNEMIRRDPQDANAYLFKILAHFGISRKEDLPSINGDTLDRVYYDSRDTWIDEDDCYITEDAEEQLERPQYLYQLFLKFANESLKQEIQHYNQLIEAKAAERKRLEEIEQAKQKEILRRQEEQQRRIAVKEKKKERAKKILKCIIPIAIIATIIIIISCLLLNKKSANEELYKSENFDVEVTNKINTESDNWLSDYAYIFKFKITNNSTKEITHLIGIMTVDNIRNEHLFVGEISLSGSIASGNYGSWNVTAYSSSNETGLELYNTQYSGLNIYFRITDISFADGVYKEYENQDIKIKSADPNYVNPKYTNAMNLYNQGKYKEAKAEFEALGNYKDSVNMLRLCNQKILEINQAEYQKGVNFLNQKNYAEAYKSFKIAIDYLDSYTKIQEIQNTVEDNAKKLINNGEYSKACEEMSSVGITAESQFYTACQYASQGYYSNLVSFGIKDVVVASGTTEILEDAFSGCSNLISVKIPDSVTSIGDYAFWDCKNLNKVYISNLANWCNIEFKNNSSNPLFYAPHLYLNDIEIIELVIPENITSIKSGPFSYYKGLKSLVIPSTLKSIGDEAFRNCSGITSISFEKGTLSIGNLAFANCTSLTDITIPDSVINLGNDAFNSCSNLASITISSSVKNIGNYAFRDCGKLKTINYSGTKAQWQVISLGTNWNPDTTYKIVCSDATYSVLSGWSN